MHLDLTDQEVDYVYRLLMTRPMGEVEPLVAKFRQQATAQQHAQQDVAFKEAAMRGNGSADLDLPALP
jgi:hypothetical protein